MEEVAQEVSPEVDAPEVDASEVDAPEMPAVPETPQVPEVTPAAPVKRPRGRPRKNPEGPKRPRGRPRKEKEVRFEEPEAAPEAAPDAVPEPSLIPDAVYVLAQALLQNEAEARRRKAERYKNMLGL